MHRKLTRRRLFWLATVARLPASSAELKPAAERFYEAYIRQFEAALSTRRHFLQIDAVGPLRARVAQGEIVVWETRAEKNPPGGLIHHWDGAVYINQAGLDEAIRFLQNYNQHKNVYKPEVIDSEILERNGNDFRIRLRLLKKRILSVVLETEHEVRYRRIDAQRWESRARSTRITEVDNPGTPRERLLPPGSGHGFLWRTDSFWRFAQDRQGVFVECTSVSLSRDIPFGLSSLIRPIVNDLPQESLMNLLKQTRDALNH